MQSAFSLALLAAVTSAIKQVDSSIKTTEPKVMEPTVAMPTTVIPDLSIPTELDAETAGECCGGNNCNCSLDLAGCGFGSGVTGSSNGGSYAYTAASAESIPDKLYKVDSVSCSDETSTGNECYDRNDCGQHTFSIEGCITINESYN